MNKAQTRTNLIDDELVKCGWNIQDITKVVEGYEIEYPPTNEILDDIGKLSVSIGNYLKIKMLIVIGVV